MGLLNAFKPKWQRDCENACAAIRETNDTNLINEIITKTRFPESDEEVVWITAANRLYEFRTRTDATAMIEKIAREGITPVVRCHAACLAGDKPEMRRIIEDNIVPAYSRHIPDNVIRACSKDSGRHMGSIGKWIELVRDPKVVLDAYAAARKNRFHLEIAEHIRTPEVLPELIRMEKNEKSGDAGRIIRYVSATDREYEQIIREGLVDGIVDGSAPIEKLSPGNEMLLYLAQQGNWAAQRSLIQKGTHKQVVAMAELGHSEALIRLKTSDKPAHEKVLQMADRGNILLMEKINTMPLYKNRYTEALAKAKTE